MFDVTFKNGDKSKKAVETYKDGKLIQKELFDVTLVDKIPDTLLNLLDNKLTKVTKPVKEVLRFGVLSQSQTRTVVDLVSCLPLQGNSIHCI